MSNGKSKRRGTTLVECIVAASVLSVALATVTMGVFRIGRLWTDTAHYRIALQEVSNHLETLTTLPPDQVQPAIDAIAISPEVARSLDGAKLGGQLVQDNFGARVRLEMTWQEGRAIRPIRLEAWLIDSQTEDSP
jgi:hypothetical protein